MSLFAHFYRMDTTHPEVWSFACDECGGSGKIRHSVKCDKCDGVGAFKVKMRVPDAQKIALRQLGIACCVIAAGIAVYLIFFGN